MSAAVRRRSSSGQVISWKPLTDWLDGDRALFHDVLEEKALSYAKEKNIAVRTTADAPIN